MNNRVFLIGIDGGTFDIINPLIKAGELPNIASFMKEGVHCSLQTTLPSTTVPAWISCVTGVNPGKHGVFYFTDSIAGSDRLMNSTAVKVKSIWRYLSDAKKRSILVTVPFTSPPEEINGIILSFSKSKMSFETYPHNLYDEIMSELNLKGEKIIRPGRLKNMPKKELLEVTSRFYFDIIEKIAEVVYYLTRKYKWDFLMVVFQSTDVFQHHFLCYTDPNHPMYDIDLAGKYRNAIYDVYKKLDNTIGGFIKAIGKNCNYIIMSDHGTGPIYKYCYLNSYLETLGFLKVKPWHSRLTVGSCRCGEILDGHKLTYISRKLPKSVSNLRIFVPSIRKDLAACIDWSSTTAYFKDYGIRINLKGRDPRGIVEKAEYHYTVEEITKNLYTLKDPDTGESVVERVYKNTELYSGPYAEKGLDLILQFKNSAYYPREPISRHIFSNASKEQRVCAHHETYKSDGIFMMKGSEVKKGVTLTNADIMDITPTVLYILDLTVPKELDGNVLTEAFTEELLSARRPSILPEDISKDTTEMPLSVEEEDKIKEDLRALGYIE